MGVYYVIIQEKNSAWRSIGTYKDKYQAIKDFVDLSWSDQESNWRIFENREGDFESVEIGRHVHYGNNSVYRM